MTQAASQRELDLSAAQRALVERPISGDTMFRGGPAGAGKTTAAVARLRHLLNQGIPADEILVLAPQRALLAPYQRALREPGLPPGGVVDTLTIGGLARRQVALFWPLVAERAGLRADRPPVFLTLETAQYYMARIADPLFDSGAFDSVTIDRNRLLSQILDNLNKAALVGLDYSQVGERLRMAWSGASVQASVYQRAQQCANDFRAYCLAHNLLDFALQIEVFAQHLLALPWPPGESFMTRFTRYRHLIVDNVEEDTPVAHDLLRGWLPHCVSALLIHDH
ncbi:MAG: AAA family ATPase, partial [Delftia sp.]|nr:AAA family ATPase [Delftia sp.]